MQTLQQLAVSQNQTDVFNLRPSNREDDTAILEPYTYLTESPGNDVRAKMIVAFNSWLNVPARELLVISSVVSTLHNASLLIDDIEDNSDLRRGRAAAHIKHGIPKTINAACHAYFLAYQKLLRVLDAPSADKHKRIYSGQDLHAIVTEELLNLHRGQGMEMIWRDSLQCPTEAEYLLMISNKTGGLFRLAVKLLMAYSTTNVDVDYIPLVNLLGEYFQVRDDYMNLDSPAYTQSKGFAEDLTEGKFSYPVIHGIRANQNDGTLIDILKQRPTSPTLKSRAIHYLRSQTKSFEHTHDLLERLDGEIMCEIERLGGNAHLEGLVEVLRVPGLNE